VEVSRLELITILLSRELEDGQIVMTGNAATVPLSAALCAQQLRAPNLVVISGSLGTVNPANPLLDKSCAYFQSRKAECTLPYSILDVDFMLGRGKVDVLFLSGLQVDMRGNVNLVCIGDYYSPKLRGPGSIGAPFSKLVKDVYIYVERHNKSTLVKQVDFISSAGYIPSEKVPQRASLQIGFPKLVVTPLCVMDFDHEKGTARLRSIHKGVTVDQVVENTGFELTLPNTIPETGDPLPEEIGVLRKIDSRGLLRVG
jgi:glutaconate CoA-transferase subunit B